MQFERPTIRQRVRHILADYCEATERSAWRYKGDIDPEEIIVLDQAEQAIMALFDEVIGPKVPHTCFIYKHIDCAACAVSLQRQRAGLEDR